MHSGGHKAGDDRIPPLIAQDAVSTSVLVARSGGDSGAGRRVLRVSKDPRRSVSMVSEEAVGAQEQRSASRLSGHGSSWGVSGCCQQRWSSAMDSDELAEPEVSVCASWSRPPLAGSPTSIAGFDAWAALACCFPGFKLGSEPVRSIESARTRARTAESGSGEGGAQWRSGSELTLRSGQRLGDCLSTRGSMVSTDLRPLRWRSPLLRPRGGTDIWVSSVSFADPKLESAASLDAAPKLESAMEFVSPVSHSRSEVMHLTATSEPRKRALSTIPNWPFPSTCSCSPMPMHTSLRGMLSWRRSLAPRPRST
mmetsp:Transcript_62521/g.147016  ORF Transcript_62521/g.147016 Transcript_62521/m.147016 type:complete len:310 (+) Transcript_62521:311-1240(+)